MFAVVLIQACKKENKSTNNALNDADNNFIKLAGIGNYSETETAKIAISKTADSVVLSFANQMLTDHTNALSDLKIMGSIVGFSVKDTIDTEHTAIAAHLDSLSGRAFDSAYIHTQLAEHATAISYYSDEVNNGNQQNVRAYANTLIQSITMHYQRADSIAEAFY